MQGSDAVLRDDLGQIVGIAMRAGLGHDQRRAIGQRPEELPNRYVEAERGLLQHDILPTESISLLHPGQTIDQRIMLVLHALGHAGGA